MELNSKFCTYWNKKRFIDSIIFPYLFADKDEKRNIQRKWSINKSAQSFKNLTRSSLSHTLVSFYEGYTIDDYNKVMNSPFYPL